MSVPHNFIGVIKSTLLSRRRLQQVQLITLQAGGPREGDFYWSFDKPVDGAINLDFICKNINKYKMTTPMAIHSQYQ